LEMRGTAWRRRRNDRRPRRLNPTSVGFRPLRAVVHRPPPPALRPSGAPIIAGRRHIRAHASPRNDAATLRAFDPCRRSSIDLRLLRLPSLPGLRPGRTPPVVGDCRPINLLCRVTRSASRMSHSNFKPF
jgi:hypothetical protein